MKNNVLLMAAAMSAGFAFGAEPSPVITVRLDSAAAEAPVKIMHAVNGGPIVGPAGGDQKRGNFRTWQAARIPFGRTHDVINNVSGGAHTCDISAVFPDFDADENDPKNYDFVFTDHYLDSMRRAGTEPFFRLGQTIEHGPKKYGVLPPKDFAKWARICEHVIRHYNEGWGWGLDTAHTTRNVAWSNQYGVVYWEIWNEPDLDLCDDPNDLPKGPRCWGGTVTNFFRFYETAAKHLKGKFPALKIGGPAICGSRDFGARFIRYCRDNAVPLDFCSWHAYAREPANIVDCARFWRKTLDANGFAKTESILNEWNYVKGWSDDFVYSLEVECGRFNQKCAAFIAGAMVDCQYAPVDMLMFYDARPGGMNALFDKTTAWPMKGYYPFYAWSKLHALGTHLGCALEEKRGAKSGAVTGVDVDGAVVAAKGGFRAVAAKNAAGEAAVFVVRYNDDNNVSEDANIVLEMDGVDFTRARCHVTDSIRSHTEVPLFCEAPGVAGFVLQPNAFALVEFDLGK